MKYRLDDGGIIGQLGGKEAVKLSATEAQEQGRLTDADKRRITQLLSIAAGHAQISPPLVNGSKRRDSDGLEVIPQPPLLRCTCSRALLSEKPDEYTDIRGPETLAQSILVAVISLNLQALGSAKRSKQRAPNGKKGTSCKYR